ncbi:MAG: hypothetical protein GTN78_22420 [Gemmatimonadales bacterium]|nr:hypothetical protein [Gemmatimonadales bacterium]NIR02922.1 hypothetical protein [Gemmatimonadales bacterium]
MGKQSGGGDSFIEVYRPEHHRELALIKARLDAAGLRYYVKNEAATLGALSSIGGDELILMIEADRADEAAVLIAEVLA